MENGIAEVGNSREACTLESGIFGKICVFEGGISLESSGLESDSTLEGGSFEAHLLAKDRAAEVQRFLEQGTGEVHKTPKFAVPYLDAGGHNRGCLRLAGRAFTVNEGQIKLGYIDVTDYCHMVKNNQITVLYPVQNLAGINYRKMRLFSYAIASMDSKSVKSL